MFHLIYIYMVRGIDRVMDKWVNVSVLCHLVQVITGKYKAQSRKSTHKMSLNPKHKKDILSSSKKYH